MPMRATADNTKHSCTLNQKFTMSWEWKQTFIAVESVL